jgi:hypothetical protein
MGKQQLEAMEGALELLERAYPVLPDPPPTTEWSEIALVFANLRAAIQDAKEYFVLTCIHRADLNSIGFDGDAVTDEQMEELAARMGDAAMTWYWDVLASTADSMELPRREHQPSWPAIQTLEELHEMASADDKRDPEPDCAFPGDYCYDCRKLGENTCPGAKNGCWEGDEQAADALANHEAMEAWRRK